jgi:hypothetical protein
MTVLLLDAGLALAEGPGQPLAPPPDGPLAGGCAGGSCANGSCAGANGAVPTDTFRVSAEYLLWTIRGGVPADLGNVLNGSGVDTGSVLNSLPLTSWRSGVRGFISYTPGADWWPGVEIGGFWLENNNGNFDATVTTHPDANPSAIPNALVLHPVVNGAILVPDSRGIVDTPLLADLDMSDTLTSHLRGTSSRKFWGLEANLLSGGCCFGGLRLNALAGFRYLTLRERLTVQGDFVFAEAPAGGDPDETPENPEDSRTNTMHTFDSVEVRNNLYGGQIGASFEAWMCDSFVISGFAKFALLGNWEQVALSGTTIQDAALIEPFVGATAIPRAAGVFPGGLFTPQIPGGTVTHSTHLSVMPDLNINLGYMVTPNFQVYVGYNYLYISDVARLGNQSVAAGNSGQGHLNLHGADFGIQFRY